MFVVYYANNTYLLYLMYIWIFLIIIGCPYALTFDMKIQLNVDWVRGATAFVLLVRFDIRSLQQRIKKIDWSNYNILKSLSRHCDWSLNINSNSFWPISEDYTFWIRNTDCTYYMLHCTFFVAITWKGL